MLPILYHAKVKKDLKHLDKAAAREILTTIIPMIAEHPEKGIRLAGELRDFHKFAFSLRGVSYRVIYQTVNEPKETLWVLFIGTRENAYDRILRRL